MNKNNLKIGVLLGGRSAEREVSLRTGEAIYRSLLAKGYSAVKIDVGYDIAEQLKSNKINLAFIALHGKWGEDGTIQGLLEMLDIPYTGSSVLSSSLCMNKIATKKILLQEGLPTPDHYLINYRNMNKVGAEKLEKKILEHINIPLVVKAPTQGSTIGISFVHQKAQLKKALQECSKYGDQLLIEKFIPGIEITASVLGNENPEALPLIEIVSATGVYDYEAKYTAGMSEHIIPPRIPHKKQKEIQKLALDAYRALWCRGLARVDFILDETGQSYILEVNTIPGMTETSLFPDAARAAGIEFPELVEKIVRLALEKERGV